MIDSEKQFAARFCLSWASLLMCCASLPAQRTLSEPPHCTPSPGVPSYNTWLDTTELPNNRPYRVSVEERKALRTGYARLEVGMSRSTVEKMLGKPDFEQLLRGSMRGSPTGSCIDQWAYILRKDDENLANSADVAIYLSFSESGRLLWAVPQHVGLKPKGSPTQK